MQEEADIHALIKSYNFSATTKVQVLLHKYC